MRLFLLSLLFFSSISVSSQSYERILFCNTENFFDTYDEINKKDEAFLPSSLRHWTPRRYKQKLSNIEFDNTQKIDLMKEEVLDFVKKAAKKSKALKKIAKLNKKSKKIKKSQKGDL